MIFPYYYKSYNYVLKGMISLIASMGGKENERFSEMVEALFT
jgi:hypothetical protein